MYIAAGKLHCSFLPLDIIIILLLLELLGTCLSGKSTQTSRSQASQLLKAAYVHSAPDPGNGICEMLSSEIYVKWERDLVCSNEQR